MCSISQSLVNNLESEINNDTNLETDDEERILKIIVDEDKCTACGNCKEICPKGGYIWTIDTVAHVSNLDYCHVCTLCAMKCGPDAIKIMRNAPDE